jgi:hypothetical protein
MKNIQYINKMAVAQASNGLWYLYTDGQRPYKTIDNIYHASYSFRSLENAKRYLQSLTVKNCSYCYPVSNCRFN